MNARTHVTHAALLLIALFSAGTLAAEPPTQLSIFVDCAHPSLPSQREVSELLGVQNFQKVYASRVSLLGEMHRACQRTHAESLNLVFDVPQPNQMHDLLVANNANGGQ